MDNKRLQGVMVRRLEQFNGAWRDIVSALAEMSTTDRAQALAFAESEGVAEPLILAWSREAEKKAGV